MSRAGLVRGVVSTADHVASLPGLLVLQVPVAAQSDQGGQRLPGSVRQAQSSR